MILKITLHCLGGVVNLELVLGSNKITLEDLVNVTRRGYKVKISEEAYEKLTGQELWWISMWKRERFLTGLQPVLESLLK